MVTRLKEFWPRRAQWQSHLQRLRLSDPYSGRMAYLLLASVGILFEAIAILEITGHSLDAEDPIPLAVLLFFSGVALIAQAVGIHGLFKPAQWIELDFTQQQLLENTHACLRQHQPLPCITSFLELESVLLWLEKASPFGDEVDEWSVALQTGPNGACPGRIIPLFTTSREQNARQFIAQLSKHLPSLAYQETPHPE